VIWTIVNLDLFGGHGFIHVGVSIVSAVVVSSAVACVEVDVVEVGEDKEAALPGTVVEGSDADDGADDEDVEEEEEEEGAVAMVVEGW